MKAYIITFTSFFFVIIILLIADISLSNVESTGGIDLSRIQTQVHDLQRQNALLEAGILKYAAYTHIASAAATMGFEPEKTQLSFSQSLPLAYNQ